MKILITGGASGLGEAITKRLAADALNEVYFTYSASEENALKVKSTFKNTFPLKCDFKNDDELKRLCDKIVEISPDVLINNAYTGSFISTHFHKIETSEFLNDFKNSVLSTVLISQAAIQVFRKRKSGKLISILTSALKGVPPLGASVYLANKAYLEELTKVWAVENAKFNITSNAVSPAFMLTAFTSAVDERLVEQIRENHPHKKLLEPQEVAETVYFLCQAGPQVNGVNILMDAGTTLN